MRRRTWISVLVLVAGCGPALDEPMEGQDDDWRLNQVEGVRQATATCPNGGNMSPTAPSFGAAIDGYSAYAGQTTCDPTAKPGVVAFRDLVLATYPCTADSGITRACSTGGTSEHKEGRAWDWGLSYPHPAATALLDWLLATDGHGNTHAMARRLGIMYMIWNNQVWKSYQASKGWQAYTGSSPHTDHVHFSFSWDGANKATTYWTAGTTPPPAPGSDGSVGPAPIQPDGGVVGSDGELLVPGQPGGSPGTPPISGHVLQGGGCSVAFGAQPPSPLLLLVVLVLVRRRSQTPKMPPNITTGSTKR